MQHRTDEVDHVYFAPLYTLDQLRGLYLFVAIRRVPRSAILAGV